MVQWTLSKPLVEGFFFFFFFIVLHCQTAVLDKSLYIIINFFIIIICLSFLFSFILGIEACDLKEKFLSEEWGKRKGTMLFENGKTKCVSHNFLFYI